MDTWHTSSKDTCTQHVSKRVYKKTVRIIVETVVDQITVYGWFASFLSDEVRCRSHILTGRVKKSGPSIVSVLFSVE
jgi:hypothetical protein